MKVIVNDRERELPETATCADLVVELGRDPDRPGAALVVNGEVVPRVGWHGTTLRDGDRVDVVEAAQGG